MLATQAWLAVKLSTIVKFATQVKFRLWRSEEKMPRYARRDMSPLETRYFFAGQKSDIFAFGKCDMFT